MFGFILCFLCTSSKINSFSKDLVPFGGEWFLETKIKEYIYIYGYTHLHMYFFIYLFMLKTISVPVGIFVSILMQQILL